ncbi:MAG TPA: hypothetical protein DDY91_15595 [Planctomycetaceae bacterium]|nr:hypothetical protein [Planctomycetaceae bacterium]
MARGSSVHDGDGIDSGSRGRVKDPSSDAHALQSAMPQSGLIRLGHFHWETRFVHASGNSMTATWVHHGSGIEPPTPELRNADPTRCCRHRLFPQ